MIFTVQDVRRDGDELVAKVLDGAAIKEARFSGEEADVLALAWVRSQRDRERYASMPPEFPTPAGIPIEIPTP